MLLSINRFIVLMVKTWLHDRSEADFFKLLIDTYRLRLIQDPKKAGDGDAHVDKHNHDHDHGNNSDPTESFRSFLYLFDTNPSLLPKWWTAAKAEECIRLGQDDQGWSSLRHSLRRSLTKADVIEHHGDEQLGVQLRLFGEQVYGTLLADTPSL